MKWRWMNEMEPCTWFDFKKKRKRVVIVGREAIKDVGIKRKEIKEDGC